MLMYERETSDVIRRENISNLCNKLVYSLERRLHAENLNCHINWCNLYFVMYPVESPDVCRNGAFW